MPERVHSKHQAIRQAGKPNGTQIQPQIRLVPLLEDPGCTKQVIHLLNVKIMKIQNSMKKLQMTIASLKE